MQPQVTAAIIAATIALFTSLAASLLAWFQLRREMKKWAVDLRTAIEVEHLKIRIQHFGRVYEIIGELSSRNKEKLSKEKANRLASALNEWFYSLGGLCADKSTRGAIIGLRQSLAEWAEDASAREIYHWRDLAVFYLRRDVHLFGLEEYDATDISSSYERLKAEMTSLTK